MKKVSPRIVTLLSLLLTCGFLFASVCSVTANPGIHGFPVRLTITSPVESAKYGPTVQVYAAAGQGYYTVSQFEAINNVDCFIDGVKTQTITGNGFFATEISNLTLGFHNLTLSGVSTWGNTVVAQSTFDVTNPAPVGNYWKVLENSPKFTYQACVDDEAVYYFSGNILSETLVKYDWQSKTLSNVASLNEIEAPVIVTMVPVEGKVYVFLRGDNLGGNYSSLGTLVFDPATHTVTNASFSPPKGFSPGWDETKGAALNGAIYITSYSFGDYSTQLFYRYTPANDSWQELPPLPTKLWDYAVTSYQGKVYVIGGYNPQTFVPNLNVQVFDVENSIWTQLSAPVSFPSTAACSETVEGGQGVIFIVGPNSTQLYYPETNQWVKGAGIPTCAAPANLFSMGGRIYAFGSTGDVGYDVSLEYVPPGGEALWSTPSPEPTLTPGPSPTQTPTPVPTASPSVHPTTAPTQAPTSSPSPTLSPTPSIEPTSTLISDNFGSVYLFPMLVIVILVIVGLVVYFRKRRK